MINIDPTKFSDEVIAMVEKRKFTVMDAILDRCELYNIDPSSVGELVSEPIKNALASEARKLHFFKPKPSNDGVLDIF